MNSFGEGCGWNVDSELYDRVDEGEHGSAVSCSTRIGEVQSQLGALKVRKKKGMCTDQGHIGPWSGLVLLNEAASAKKLKEVPALVEWVSHCTVVLCSSHVSCRCPLTHFAPVLRPVSPRNRILQSAANTLTNLPLASKVSTAKSRTWTRSAAYLTWEISVHPNPAKRNLRRWRNEAIIN